MSLAKTVAIGAVVGIGSLFMLGGFKGKKRSDLVALLDKVRAGVVLKDAEIRSVRDAKGAFPTLSDEQALVLFEDPLLGDLVQQVQPFKDFDPDVTHAFLELSAGAAEFLLLVPDDTHKKSLAKRFRGFTVMMNRRLKELRQAIRDKAPGMLQEFDEFSEEVDQYGKGRQHDLWCDA